MDYYFKVTDTETWVRCVSADGYSTHSTLDNGPQDAMAYAGPPVWDTPGWNRCNKEQAQGILGFDLDGEDSSTEV